MHYFQWTRTHLKPIYEGLMSLDILGVACPLLFAFKISLQIDFEM